MAQIFQIVVEITVHHGRSEETEKDTEETKKRKGESVRARVNLSRWRELCDMKGCRTDAKLGILLLD